MKVPIVEFLRRKFLNHYLLFNKAYELLDLIQYIFNVSPYEINFNIGLIGQIIDSWHNFGKISAFSEYYKFNIPETLNKLYNFEKKFQGKLISEFSFSEVESMFNDIVEKIPDTNKHFSMGLFHWLQCYYKYYTSELLNYYKEELKGKDKLEFNEIVNAEMKMIFTNEACLGASYYHYHHKENKENILDEEKIIYAEKILSRESFNWNERNNNNYGLLTLEMLNFDENKKIEIKNIEEVITKVTNAFFEIEYEYNKEKEIFFEKNDYKIKLSTFDLYKNKIKLN